MNKGDTLYLRHILEAIAKIQRYTKGLAYEEFAKNSLIHDGVIRELEIIGEAAKRISEETRTSAAQIPWRGYCRNER